MSAPVKEVEAARQQKLKGVKNAQIWFFLDAGVLVQFWWFCLISFGSLLVGMMIGWWWLWKNKRREWIQRAGVFFCKALLASILGMQYPQNWADFVLWVAFDMNVSRLLLWPMTIMMMRSCIEHHWTLTGVDHVAPCGHAPQNIARIWWRQEHRKKELEKKARSRSAPCWASWLWRCNVFLSSNARQGVQIKLVWSPVQQINAVLMPSLTFVTGWSNLRRQLQLARGPWSTHKSLRLAAVQLCVFGSRFSRSLQRSQGADGRWGAKPKQNCNGLCVFNMIFQPFPQKNPKQIWSQNSENSGELSLTWFFAQDAISLRAALADPSVANLR